MLYVYIGCFTFGLVYAIISAIFGSHGFDHGGIDSGGLHTGALDHGGLGHAGFDHAGLDHVGLDHAGLDHAGLDHVGADGSSGDMPSPFNPLVIASAIATFGAVGLIGMLGLKLSNLWSLVMSLGFAGVVGTAIFFGVVKLVYSSQSDSTFSVNELEGTEAEVITPIPAKGLGEIAYVINGMRCNMPARSAQSQKIGRGERVRVKEIAGNVAEVSQMMTIDELEMDELEKRINEKKENDII